MEAQEALGKENGGTDVKQLLLTKLMSSGLLNSVKAHLRARLFADLKGKDLNSVLQPPTSPTLEQHVLNCLVTEYLLSQQYKYTLSVFLSESGTHKLPQLSHADLLRLVGVAQGSKVHHLLLAHASDGCLATGIVQTLAHIESCAPTTSSACQTDEQPTASAHLLARLQQIEDEYRERSQQVERQSTLSLEERMAEYQRDCEGRFAAQLHAQVAKLREEELGAVREQEAAKCQQQLTAERQALQLSYQERLDKLRMQEEDLLEKAHKAQHTLDQLREEHAQRMRGEEERLRGWREQEEALLAAKASEARRRLEHVDKQDRLAAEWQREAEQKLHEQRQALQQEMQRREEDVRRQQASLNLEKEELHRSRADLAACAAEAELLRRQLASQSECPMREKAQQQQEIDRLRSQLELQDKLARKAARQTEGLKQRAPAAGSIKQQQEVEDALHSLQRQQVQLQQELVVGRARERVWRESASTSERLLEKASKWHEQCLQHVEELRLALAAAVRDVADLQQQAQLAAGEGSGHLGLALASAISDAQRWREATLPRLDVASQEEGRLRQELSRLHQRATANRLHAAQALQGLLATYVQSRRAPLSARPQPAAAADEEPLEQQTPEEEVEGEQPEAGIGSHTEAADAASLSQPADGASEGSSSAGSSPRQHHSPRPVSRTTSHILAAYRARQQATTPRAASPAGIHHQQSGEMPPPAALLDRVEGSTGDRQEGCRGGMLGTAGSPIGADRGHESPTCEQEPNEAGSTTGNQQGCSSQGEAPSQQRAASPEDYYISDVSSDDSKF